MAYNLHMIVNIHSLIQTISIAPLQVHVYSEALPTQHGYCAGVSRRSATVDAKLNNINMCHNLMSNIIYERFAEDKEIFCVHCIELNIPISGRSDLVMEKAEAAMNEHDSMLITCINDHLVIV